MITGPNGYVGHPQPPVSPPPSDTRLTVVNYLLTAPGGTWDASDNGTYAILVVNNQVTDTSGNGIDAEPIGTFSVDLPSTLTIEPSDADKAEGNSSTTLFTFTVTRKGDLSVPRLSTIP